MGALLRLLDRSSADAVRWLDLHYIGPLLRVVSTLAIALIPVAIAFNTSTRIPALVPFLETFRNPLWLIPFGVAALLLAFLSHYYQGGSSRRLLDRIASVNGSFAGALETFEMKAHTNASRSLTDAECENVCTALLHRIRDFAEIALTPENGPSLRATLAVPYASAGRQIDSLRVWCYDQTYPNRQYTIIQLETNGIVAPGAPRAYVDPESWQIIKDMGRVPGVSPRPSRPYKSVVSFAVPAKDPSGKPLAVISVDATDANFFRLERVLTDLRPLIAPVVSAIGLVLASRENKGAPYVFPS